MLNVLSKYFVSKDSFIKFLLASHTVSGFDGGNIRAWCCSQDIIEVIGRFVALDHRGVGSCPFKEHHHRGDIRPSFQVFGAMTRIGIAIPGGVRMISLILYVCITRSRRKKPGGDYKMVCWCRV